MKAAWIAMVGAPSAALAAQLAMYALVTPSCSAQTRIWIHAAAALALLVAVVLGWLAWAGGRARPSEPAAGPDDELVGWQAPRRFGAMIGALVAGLSALVILAMWFAAWVLSPCLLL
jgi:hypothetical protein